MILFSICDIPWWLLWLLPLLVAALIWWWKNSEYNKMVDDYEDRINGLNGRITALEEDLAACKSKRSELEGDLALTKGRMREMESEMRALNAGNSNYGDSNVGFAASLSDSDASSGGDESGSGDTSDVDGKGRESSFDAGSAALGSITSSLAGGVDTGGLGSGIYAKVKSDNLQIIEGIGPKMESVLKENGIDNHTTLGSKSLDDLQAILNKYGDKYKIIDPTTWAQQAKLAGDGDFDGLISLQKSLNGGKSNAAGTSDSKLEKYLIKIGALKAFKQDDLKAIEGIGPATDKLLRENGIDSWRALANSSSERLQAILNAAGSRFALGDPSTWPRQAELAADGKFDELRAYQDELDGGKA